MVGEFISLINHREVISLLDLRWMVGEFISLINLRRMEGEFISLTDLRWMVGEFISLIDLSFKVIPVKLFLNIAPSSSPNNVTTLVARMFSWMLLSLLCCPRLQNMRHRVTIFRPPWDFRTEAFFIFILSDKSLERVSCKAVSVLVVFPMGLFCFG